MNRPKHPLRQQHREQRRHNQRDDDGAGGVPQGAPQLAPDQQRRHINANHPNSLIAERASAARISNVRSEIDRAELLERAGGRQPREILLLGHRLPFERREAVRDGDLVAVDDGRVGDVGRVGAARLDNRSDAAVGAQRRVRIGGPLRDDFRARWKIACASICPREAVLEVQAGQRGQMVAAEDSDHHDHIVVTPATCLALMLTCDRASLRSRGLAHASLRIPSSFMPIQLVVQRLQTDAENFGGARLVVARVVERQQDQPAFRFVHGRARRDRQRRQRLLAARDRASAAGGGAR